MNRYDRRELLLQIDSYLQRLYAPPAPALPTTLRRPSAAVAAARRILEIGTLGGYSTIYLARALPEGGALVSLELEERHAEVARENVAEAGLEDKVEVRFGDAKALPARMVEDGEDRLILRS